MNRIEAIPEAAGVNIMPRQQGVPEKKKPQRGGEDFKLYFDDACKQIREKEARKP